MFKNLSRKAYLIKNFIAINVSFVLVYSAVNCVASIQSIVNQDENLGTTSQSVNFAFNILTSLVLPQIIRELFGFKLGLALGQFLALTYVVVQIYPTWLTLIPSMYCCFPIYLSFQHLFNLKLNIKQRLSSLHWAAP
jgi:hypothetical protein